MSDYKNFKVWTVKLLTTSGEKTLGDLTNLEYLIKKLKNANVQKE